MTVIAWNGGMINMLFDGKAISMFTTTLSSIFILPGIHFFLLVNTDYFDWLLFRWMILRVP